MPFALVTHHFGSKLGLYKAVFARRSAVLTTERLARLDAIRIEHDPKSTFAAIAAAIVEPLMRVRAVESGLAFSRLLARELNDPREGERGIIQDYLDPVAEATVSVLRRAAPEAPVDRLHWSYYFAVGALAIVHANSGRLERLSDGVCDASDTETLVAELTHFIAAGLMSTLKTASPISEKPQPRKGPLKRQHSRPSDD